MIKRALVPSESQEQGAVIRWWASYAATKGIDPRLLISIPNGAVLAGNAQRRAIQMAKLKREGLRAGAPDLFLAIPKKMGILKVPLFAGLFVEMKKKGAKASPAQVEMMDLLRRSGYNAVLAEGFEEAKRAIVGYLET